MNVGLAFSLKQGLLFAGDAEELKVFDKHGYWGRRSQIAKPSGLLF